MLVYLDVVILLNFLVDFLLLISVNRLTGYPTAPGRAALAAAFGGLYGGVCLLPGLLFLGNALWRTVALAAISCLAFGWNASALRRGALFVLLSMALGGIAVGMDHSSFGSVACGAGSVVLLCVFGLKGKLSNQRYASITVRKGNKCKTFLALRDTGNELRDPVTGESVVILGADAGMELLGLTRQQLSDPVSAIASGFPAALRLLPYSAVGRPGGMLLGANMDKVEIDGVSAGRLVAFAPENIGSADGFQALTGG